MRATSDILVKSPLSGVIAALDTNIGETVGNSTTLALIEPEDGELMAFFDLDPSAVGFVETGQLVQVEISSFPKEQYGVILGKIKSVTSVPLGTGSNQPLNNSAFRAVVELEENVIKTEVGKREIKSGMTVSGDIRVGRKKLYKWITDPILDAINIKNDS